MSLTKTRLNEISDLAQKVATNVDKFKPMDIQEALKVVLELELLISKMTEVISDNIDIFSKTISLSFPFEALVNTRLNDLQPKVVQSILNEIFKLLGYTIKSSSINNKTEIIAKDEYGKDSKVLVAREVFKYELSY